VLLDPPSKSWGWVQYHPKHVELNIERNKEYIIGTSSWTCNWTYITKMYGTMKIKILRLHLSINYVTATLKDGNGKEHYCVKGRRQSTKQHTHECENLSEPEQLSWYSYSLRAGRSVDRNLVGFPHPSERPWRPPSLVNNTYWVYFPGVQLPGHVAHRPHFSPLWAFIVCFTANFIITREFKQPIIMMAIIIVLILPNNTILFLNFLVH
jgi:hypothetical protein